VHCAHRETLHLPSPSPSHSWNRTRHQGLHPKQTIFFLSRATRLPMLSESQRDESRSLAAPKRLQLAYADARFVAQPRNTVLLQELACSLRRGRALQFQMPLQSIKFIGERVHAVTPIVMGLPPQ